MSKGEPGMATKGEKGDIGQKGEKGDRGHLGLPVSTFLASSLCLVSNSLLGWSLN